MVRHINPDGSPFEEPTSVVWPGRDTDFTRLKDAIDHGCDGRTHCRPNQVQCTNHAQLKDQVVLNHFEFVARHLQRYFMGEFMGEIPDRPYLSLLDNATVVLPPPLRPVPPLTAPPSESDPPLYGDDALYE